MDTLRVRLGVTCASTFLISGTIPQAYLLSMSLTHQEYRPHSVRFCELARRFLACVADETKPRYSPSVNQRPKTCSVPRVLLGFSIIGSNWLLHMAALSYTVIETGREINKDVVAPKRLSQIPVVREDCQIVRTAFHHFKR